MFKIIALVTALSGQPIDVLVSNNTHPNCPNDEALANIGNELSSKLDEQMGGHKYNISDIRCVAVTDVIPEAQKMLTQRGS